MSLATGGDGGGSIRIPAGYTGLLGMKGTFGRIPCSPNAFSRPNTVVLGNLARSVRDAARYFDVCGGVDGRDPTSLPKHEGFESGLGRNELRGRRVAYYQGEDFTRKMVEALRLDRMEANERRVLLAGNLLEPAEEASRSLGRYLDTLRRTPGFRDLFTSISATSLQREGDSDTLMFEITMKLRPPPS